MLIIHIKAAQLYIPYALAALKHLTGDAQHPANAVCQSALQINCI